MCARNVSGVPVPLSQFLGAARYYCARWVHNLLLVHPVRGFWGTLGWSRRVDDFKTPRSQRPTPGGMLNPMSIACVSNQRYGSMKHTTVDVSLRRTRLSAGSPANWIPHIQDGYRYCPLYTMSPKDGKTRSSHELYVRALSVACRVCFVTRKR